MDFLIHWPLGPVVATVQCQGLRLVQVEVVGLSPGRVLREAGARGASVARTAVILVSSSLRHQQVCSVSVRR